ncbi:MAG: putative Ig domain-containing protein [Bryobacteraceae bacterium]
MSTRWRLCKPLPLLLAAGATLLHAQGTVTITTTALPNAFLNTSYSFVLTANPPATTAPYTWSATGLPPGLILNSGTGAITGAPTAAGTFSVAISLTSQVGNASTVLPLTVIAPVPPLQITTYPVLLAGTAGVPYTGSIAATGGTSPYTFAIVRGTLPAGLTFSPAGSFGGTPVAFGSSSFTVQVTDSVGGTNARDFTLVIAPAKLTLTTPPLSNTILATPLSIQFTATGGVPPYTFVEFGTLPPGTQFSSSGALTGTPTALGTYQFLVFVDDTTGASASQTFSITIVEASLVITTAPPLPSGVIGSGYSTTFAAAGGKPPYLWTAKGLPTGLVLANTTGLLTGIPTQDGVFTIAVTVTDSSVGAFFSTTQNFSLTINPIKLIFTNAPLPNGTVGAAYTAILSTSGGDAPINFAVTGLPPGITLSAAGSLTGTPTTAGSYTVTVSAKDANGLAASTSYTVSIAPQLVITTTSVGNAVLGSGFSAKLAASGGTPPYIWLGSNLPAGLGLAQDGTLSGTPALAGIASFSVTVIDSNSAFTSKTLSVTVALPTGPGVTFSGIGSTATAATQPSLTVSLGSIYPADVTVKLTMMVVTDSGLTDPAFQFATGGPTAQTVVPAGSTGSLTAVPIQLGTDAATVTITAQLLVGTTDVTLSPASKLTFRLNAAPPVITSMTATRTSTGFTVTIVGYATSRDVTTANFTFSATAGANIGTSQLSVSVSSIFAPWYSSAPSAPYGSQFTFTQPFTVTGSNTAILSVSATLVNSVGTSPAASANLQ